MLRRFTLWARWAWAQGLALRRASRSENPPPKKTREKRKGEKKKRKKERKERKKERKKEIKKLRKKEKEGERMSQL